MHTLFNGLIKEKFVVLNFAEAFRLHTTRKKKEIDATPVPKIQTITMKAVIYEGKTYIIDNSNSLIGDIVDFYEKKDHLH